MDATLWMILLIGLGTYLFRAGSLVLGSRLKWSDKTREWLAFVSPAVLGALLGPLLLLNQDQWVNWTENKALIAAVPTILVAWWSRRLLPTVAAGVGLYAVAYYLL